MAVLESLGFSAENIEVFEDYYRVEGDIRFEKKDMYLYKPQTRQYHCGELIYDLNVTFHNRFYIKVKIDPTLINQSNWEEVILDAINAWNTEPVCGLYMSYVTSGDADITLSKRYYAPLPNGQVALGESSFPRSGKPGPTVYINADIIDSRAYSKGKKTYLVMHELGHNVGLRHTDWMNRNNQGGRESDAIHIPGTPTTNSDENSLMWSTHINQSYPSKSFSSYDKIALQRIYPPFWISNNRMENNARVYNLASRIPIKKVEWSNPDGRLVYHKFGDEVHVIGGPVGTHILQAKVYLTSTEYVIISTDVKFSPIQITANLTIDGQPAGTLTRTLISLTSYNLKDVFQDDFIIDTGIELNNLYFQGFYYEDIGLSADSEDYMSHGNESLEMRYSTDSKVYPLFVTSRGPDGAYLPYNVEIYKNYVYQPIANLSYLVDYIDITGEFTADDTMILKFTTPNSSNISNVMVSEILTGYNPSIKYKLLYEQKLDNYELYAEIPLHAGPMMINCFTRGQYIMKACEEDIYLDSVISEGCFKQESQKGKINDIVYIYGKSTNPNIFTDDPNNAVFKENIRYYDKILKDVIANSKKH